MNESEEGRVGILMCAGCAFVCLLLVVSIALTEVAMQDRRLVSCADALASAGVSEATSGLTRRRRALASIVRSRGCRIRLAASGMGSVSPGSV